MELTSIMVTCGGRQTIPRGAAGLARSQGAYGRDRRLDQCKSAGTGTPRQYDEFPKPLNFQAIEVIAAPPRSVKAIIIMNPAEPRLIMRAYRVCAQRVGRSWPQSRLLLKKWSRGAVNSYVAWATRLKQRCSSIVSADQPLNISWPGSPEWIEDIIFLEVEGRRHLLPLNAGNLDIMTSAALATAERFGRSR